MTNITTTNDPPPLCQHTKDLSSPPIILKTSEETREHMKVITTAFPNIRSKLRRARIKLYTNTSTDYHKLKFTRPAPISIPRHHTKKDERPIKVVTKDYPVTRILTTLSQT
ncbi:hypothetical protein TNCV_4090951 [Trichonephila clavipes]|nr:hypothetical protein TNCV_4090951 [Trichonephila clavipes]